MSDFQQQVVWFTPGRPARHPTLPSLTMTQQALVGLTATGPLLTSNFMWTTGLVEDSTTLTLIDSLGNTGCSHRCQLALPDDLDLMRILGTSMPASKTRRGEDPIEYKIAHHGKTDAA